MLINKTTGKGIQPGAVSLKANTDNPFSHIRDKVETGNNLINETSSDLKKVEAFLKQQAKPVRTISESENSPGAANDPFLTDLKEVIEEKDLTDNLQSAQDAWKSEQFSDPSRHDPQKYLYIVHSLNQCIVGDMKILYGKGRKADLVKNPQDISEMSVISATLVSQEKPMTFGMGMGLILKVPKENIIAAHPVDMQSSKIRNLLDKDKASAAEKTVEKFEKSGLRSPEQLLKDTPSDYFNELLILGTSPGGAKVEVAGYFTKAIDGVDPAKLMAPELKTIAEQNELPLITLDSGQININRLLEFGWKE